MYLTDFMGKACIEEYAFRSCGLAGIDVRHDADISGIL